MLLKFFSLALSGSVISMIFPDGKYKNVLKTLLSVIITLAVISIFSSADLNFDFDFEESENYETNADSSLENVIISLAKKEAMKIMDKNAVIPENIEFSVCETNNTFYVENIKVFFEKIPENSEEIKNSLSETFGLSKINISFCEA